LALRARPDLILRPQQFGRQMVWVVKDPVALKYFHLREEEHALLEMLDGQTSLAELKRRFEASFAPLQVGVEQLHAFLGRLHQLGLLVADAPGQGQQLLERLAIRRRQAWRETLANILAIRLSGVDPEPLLRWLYPKCRWLFSVWFLAVALLMIVSAATFVVLHFVVIQARLPSFHAFFTGGNLFWLAAALMATKILHELGHALTCRHFGGECHELGVLLLVFTPCLYCDVSDAWLFANKWQRIAVSAAGIGIEVCLAAAAGFLWWFSVAGLFNTLCLNVMFICSVNTLLFNGNPLLRYDGYYVLSDLLEVPNLAQQSRALLDRGLTRLFLGIVPPADRSLPHDRRLTLAAYGAASGAYRWLVTIGILWFCHRALKPYGLQVLAELLGGMVIAGMVIVPLGRLCAFLSDPARHDGHWPRMTVLGLSLLLAVAGGVLLVPLPFHVAAPTVLEPHDAHRVYIVAAGTVEQLVTAGQSVAKRQPLARLVNLELRKETTELAGQRDQQRLQLTNLRLRLANDGSVASQIPAAEAALADLEQRLHQRQRDQENLVLRAPVQGTVLPPPCQPPPTAVPGQLRAWQGTPLEERNRGCYLETGTLFCLVGPPLPLEAFLVIEQSDMNFVRPGQQVRLAVDEMPGRVLFGTVVEVAKTDLKVAPRELGKGSDLPIRVDEKGVSHPQTTSYQVRVALDKHEGNLLAGTRGRAKILADPQPLGQRWYRSLRSTFHFAL